MTNSYPSYYPYLMPPPLPYAIPGVASVAYDATGTSTSLAVSTATPAPTALYDSSTAAAAQALYGVNYSLTGQSTATTTPSVSTGSTAAAYSSYPQYQNPYSSYSTSASGVAAVSAASTSVAPATDPTQAATYSTYNYTSDPYQYYNYTQSTARSTTAPTSVPQYQPTTDSYATQRPGTGSYSSYSYGDTTITTTTAVSSPYYGSNTASRPYTTGGAQSYEHGANPSKLLYQLTCFIKFGILLRIYQIYLSENLCTSSFFFSVSRFEYALSLSIDYSMSYLVNTTFGHKQVRSTKHNVIGIR
ncbi:hypothetical protein LOD99_14743 [Oopsacas minuta]|uniref:Uncharacterized protein n=1 Tax=Oopsacas minuta TaxID=111878 RepID=A0AAV7KD06_9METZ|nr:hypothetical protein LOD99_14743 [Oopsacas minuta]